MMSLLVNKIISPLPWQGMNYGLKHLDLSWNCIRFKGAVGMAQGLKVSLVLTATDGDHFLTVQKGVALSKGYSKNLRIRT